MIVENNKVTNIHILKIYHKIIVDIKNFFTCILIYIFP